MNARVGRWVGRLLAASSYRARQAVGWTLRAYRVVIAPALGPVCRFEPSCSHYAEEAVALHGLARGGALVAYRLLRCQPFARGGLDPVPPLRSTRSYARERT